MLNPNKRFIFLAVNCLAVLGWISANIYLPSIPTMEQYFQASPKDLKFSISIFFLGFALSQFFWGSLSERLGRKKPILYGLLIASIGTTMVLFAPNILVFNIARCIEGIGIGAAAVLTRAVLADSFSKIELSQAFSLITTTANIMPALAPIVGGYLLFLAGWRSVFVFLLFYTLFLFIIFLKGVPETYQDIKPDFKLTQAFKQYWQVLTNRLFLGYLAPYMLLSGGMIGFYAATPFIFISVLHMAPEHYAFLSIFTVTSYIVGANLASRLAKRVGFNKAILTGISLALLAGLSLVFCWAFVGLNGFTIIIPMMIYTFSAGIVSPNTNASAMMVVKDMAGSASAVMGTSVYVASAILSAVLTSLNLDNLNALAGYITGLAIVALLGFGSLILLKKA